MNHLYQFISTILFIYILLISFHHYTISTITTTTTTIKQPRIRYFPSDNPNDLPRFTFEEDSTLLNHILQNDSTFQSQEINENNDDENDYDCSSYITNEDDSTNNNDFNIPNFKPQYTFNDPDVVNYHDFFTNTTYTQHIPQSILQPHYDRISSSISSSLSSSIPFQSQAYDPNDANAPKLLNDIEPVFEPIRCEKYRGSYCSSFFGHDFYIGIGSTATQEDREYQIWRRRIRLLTASTPLRCDLRILANFCSRAFLPCRTQDIINTDTGAHQTKILTIPYCKDFCDHVRCPTIASIIPDHRVCYDPFRTTNTISVPQGYSCESALNWAKIANLNISATMQSLLPPCPDPLINVKAGDPLAFNGGYCASPCPSPLYTKSQYSSQDTAITTLNIISLLCLILLITSWVLFPRLRLKQYVYYYLSCIGIITFSLTILIFIAWSKNIGVSGTLCRTQTNEYHGRGYPFIQGLLCIFFFMASACWSLICSIDIFLIVVLGINITPKHRHYRSIQISYHIFCWGIALYSLLGPLINSQIGSSPVGGSFAWISPSRLDFVYQQNHQLTTNDKAMGSSYDYRSIYDSGNTFVYYPLWVISGTSVILIFITIFRLARYSFATTNYGGQHSSNNNNNNNNNKDKDDKNKDKDDKNKDKDKDDKNNNNNNNNNNKHENTSQQSPPIRRRTGGLSLETFIRLLLFILFNVLICIVFACHKLFVVDRRGTLDNDETQYFICVSGTYLVYEDYSRYTDTCSRLHSVNASTTVLLSALLNTMGIIAFLTYGTTKKLWRAWGGFWYTHCGIECFHQYQDSYFAVMRTSTRITQGNQNNNGDINQNQEQTMHFVSQTTEFRPKQPKGNKKGGNGLILDNGDINNNNNNGQGIDTNNNDIDNNNNNDNDDTKSSDNSDNDTNNDDTKNQLIEPNNIDDQHHQGGAAFRSPYRFSRPRPTTTKDIPSQSTTTESPPNTNTTSATPAKDDQLQQQQQQQQQPLLSDQQQLSQQQQESSTMSSTSHHHNKQQQNSFSDHYRSSNNTSLNNIIELQPLPKNGQPSKNNNQPHHQSYRGGTSVPPIDRTPQRHNIPNNKNVMNNNNNNQNDDDDDDDDDLSISSSDSEVDSGPYILPTNPNKQNTPSITPISPNNNSALPFIPLQLTSSYNSTNTQLSYKSPLPQLTPVSSHDNYSHSQHSYLSTVPIAGNPNNNITNSNSRPTTPTHHHVITTNSGQKIVTPTATTTGSNIQRINGINIITSTSVPIKGNVVVINNNNTEQDNLLSPGPALSIRSNNNNNNNNNSVYDNSVHDDILTTDNDHLSIAPSQGYMSNQALSKTNFTPKLPAQYQPSLQQPNQQQQQQQSSSQQQQQPSLQRSSRDKNIPITNNNNHTRNNSQSSRTDFNRDYNNNNNNGRNSMNLNIPMNNNKTQIDSQADDLLQRLEKFDLENSFSISDADSD